jgi:hypothetical protein
MEILSFAVEYIGIKTPQGHRLQPQENAIITKKVNDRGFKTFADKKPLLPVGPTALSRL